MERMAQMSFMWLSSWSALDVDRHRAPKTPLTPAQRGQTQPLARPGPRTGLSLYHLQLHRRQAVHPWAGLAAGGAV